MPRQRFDKEKGWISHDEVIKEMEDKKRENGSLTDSEEAELTRLKEFKGDDKKENTKSWPSIVR